MLISRTHESNAVVEEKVAKRGTLAERNSIRGFRFNSVNRILLAEGNHGNGQRKRRRWRSPKSKSKP